MTGRPRRRRRPNPAWLAALVAVSLLVAWTAERVSQRQHAASASAAATTGTPASRAGAAQTLRQSAATGRSTATPRSSSAAAAVATSRAAGRMRPAAVGPQLLIRTIPGRVSHFVGRPAYIWLPPSVRQNPRRRLPVLELLHGVPGGPPDWVKLGNMQATAQAFARAHGGVAPIIVMPDENGAQHADTECVTTNHGNVETYLTTDVPAYVEAHFPATSDPRGWAIAGLSEGGTCAIMLALRHQNRYRVFGDLSGLARPTVGDTDAPQRTRIALFGGSQAAYDQHDPTWLLPRHSYRALSGYFGCGSGDGQSIAAQRLLATDSKRAGITLRAGLAPGGHNWRFWSGALVSMLPWIWQHLRTTGL